MSTAIKPVPRVSQRRPRPSENGLPDPRPLAEYTATASAVSGKTRITIVLDQPCVIRNPSWPVIDSATGARTYPPAAVIVDNQTFYFQFTTALAATIGFIEVPYQDMQVQNFQGGFVRPGGQWFRASA